MPGNRLRILGAAMIAGSAAFAAPASAQAIDDDFWIQGSGFLANVDTEIRSTTAINPGGGTVIDLEDDLDFDDGELLPAIYAGARLGGGFVITAEYFALGRDSTATIDRAITVDDVTYPVNGSVTAGFDTSVYRLSLGYIFAGSETSEFGAALGLIATELDFSISGSGTVGGAPLSNQVRRKDVLAPIPTIGVFGSFEPAPRVIIGGKADYFGLGIDDYDGSILNLQASAQYRIMDNVGIGVAYRYVDYDLDVEKDTYVASFDYNFWGPSFFIEIGF
jgi:hypothetical protein